MKALTHLTCALLASMAVTNVARADTSDCPETLNFTKRMLASGDKVRLCDAFRGKVVLVVNTASKCGFTHQYEGLEALYRDYKDRGLVVVGFPSNDFGGQEPGNEEQISKFCKMTYGVAFPMFEKTHAAQTDADPLYQTLGRIAGEFPRWNFHKYLLDRDGKLVGSFNGETEPNSEKFMNAVKGAL